MGKELRITFYGDFTFGENYQARYDYQEKVNILRQKGYDYLFNEVEHFFNKSDYNIVNLESPITNVQKSDLENKKACIHWCDIEIAPKIMKKYNIHAASLGNNHGYDYGEEGLKQSLEALEQEGIEYFGAGRNIEEAKKYITKSFEIGERKLNLYVFGGYKYREDYDKEFHFYAGANKGGVNLLMPECVSDTIKTIKSEDENSFIVMFPHFGFDLQKTVPMQKEMARGFIDAGADMVIGHGPHMMNQIEYYNGKPIVYSLGNFIFPADFRGRMTPLNLVCSLVFKEDSLKPVYELYPVYMDTNSKTPQTRLCKKEEINEVIKRLLEEDGDDSIKNSISQDDSNPLGICLTLNI